MSFELQKVKAIFPDMKVHVQRFWDDLVMFWDNAEARADLSHAYVNIFVEWFRVTAYTVGHIVSWVLVPLTIALCIPFLIVLGICVYLEDELDNDN